MTELKLIKLSDIQPEPVEWLWEPYIPNSAITLIQGDGGDGKTTTALAIAAAVTNGTALPNGVGGELASVIIQNAEDSYAQTIRPRLEKFGADCDRIEFIDEDETALSLSDERIEQAIVRTGAKLLIIDPVQAYLGGANMNSANGIRPLMKRLGDVAARHRCAILLVGHMNKKGGKAQYRGLGSIDIFAAARSVLTVGRVTGDANLRAVVHNKSNLSAAGTPLAFVLDPIDGFAWVGDYDITIEELLGGKGQATESQLDKAQRLIKTTLNRSAVSATEMEAFSAENGISRKTLHRAKSALGVISVKRNGIWYWELPIDVDFVPYEEDSQDGLKAKTWIYPIHASASADEYLRAQTKTECNAARYCAPFLRCRANGNAGAVAISTATAARLATQSPTAVGVSPAGAPTATFGNAKVAEWVSYYEIGAVEALEYRRGKG